MSSIGHPDDHHHEQISKEMGSVAPSSKVQKTGKVQGDVKKASPVQFQKAIIFNLMRVYITTLNTGSKEVLGMNLIEEEEAPELGDIGDEGDVKIASKSEAASKAVGGKKAAEKAHKEAEKSKEIKNLEHIFIAEPMRKEEASKKESAKAKGQEVADSGSFASIAKGASKDSQAKATAQANDHTQAHASKEEAKSKSPNEPQTKSASKDLTKHEPQQEAKSQQKNEKSQLKDQSHLSFESSKHVSQNPQHASPQESLKRQSESRSHETAHSSETKKQNHLEHHSSTESQRAAHTHASHVRSVHQNQSQNLEKGLAQHRSEHHAEEKVSHETQSMKQKEKLEQERQRPTKAEEKSHQDQNIKKPQDSQTPTGSLFQIASQLKKSHQHSGLHHGHNPKEVKTSDLKASQVVQSSSDKGSSDEQSGKEQEEKQSLLKQQQNFNKATFSAQKNAKEKTQKQNEEQQNNANTINTLAASEYAASYRKIDQGFFYAQDRLTEAKKIGLKPFGVVRKSSGGNQGDSGDHRESEKDPYKQLREEAEKKIEESIEKKSQALLDAAGIDEQTIDLIKEKEPLSMFVPSDEPPENLLEAIKNSPDFSDTEGGNPFSKAQGSVSDFFGLDDDDLDQKPADTGPSKNDSFTLFPDEYRLNIDDSVSIETEATAATFRYEIDSSNHADHINELEIKTQEYAAYVSDYLSSVHGYRLHAFDGVCSFTSDLTPLKKTKEYKHWLEELNKYQDDYLASKTALTDFEGTYQGAKTSYNLAYDQTELFVNLEESVTNAFSKINYQSLENAIHSLQSDLLKSQENVQGVFKGSFQWIEQERLSYEQELSNEERQISIEKSEENKKSKDTKEIKEAIAQDQSFVGKTQEKITQLGKCTDLILNFEISLNDKLALEKPIDMNQFNVQLQELFHQLSTQGAPESIISQLSSLNDHLETYNQQAKDLAAKKSELIKNLKTYFSSIAKETNLDISYVKVQEEHYNSLSSTVHPLEQTLSFLETMYNNAKKSMRSNTISELWEKAQSTNTYTQSIAKEVCSPQAIANFNKKKAALESAQRGLTAYRDKLSKAKEVYKEHSNCPIPPLKRYEEGYSPYGKAMMYLEKYKAEMANIRGLTPAFDEYYRVASSPPRKVQTYNITKAWETMLHDIGKVPDSIGDIVAASAFIVTAIIATVGSCGIIGGGVLMTMAIQALQHARSAYHTLVHATIPGASATYLGLVETLSEMQNHNDTLWHQKLEELEVRVEGQVTNDVIKTVREERESRKSVHQQQRNLELIMKVAREIAIQRKHSEKTYSYFG